jgi:hypothetical protein
MVRAVQAELQPLVVAAAPAEVRVELEILAVEALAAHMAVVVVAATEAVAAGELWCTEMEYL